MTAAIEGAAMPGMDDDDELRKHWPTPKGYANGVMAEGRILVTGGIVGWDETGRFRWLRRQRDRTFQNIAPFSPRAGPSRGISCG